MDLDEQIRTEIRALLPKSDLNQTTAKSVRQQLELILETDLTDKKAFIKQQIEQFLAGEEDDSEGEEEEEEVEANLSRKRPKSVQSTALSEPLMKFLGTEDSSLSFQEVQKQLMAYVKNLPKDERQKAYHVLDPPLVKLFGVKKCKLFGVSKYLKKHIKRFVETTEEEEERPAKKPKPHSSKKPAAKKSKSTSTTSAGGFAQTNLRLSAALQAVVGESELSRPQVVKHIWAYIKEHNLQNPNDKREIICDKLLKAVFDGEKRVTMFSMNKYLSAHLTKI